MIAGAAAAQIVKQQIEGEDRRAKRPASRGRSRVAAPRRLRMLAATALHAAAERLAPENSRRRAAAE